MEEANNDAVENKNNKTAEELKAEAEALEAKVKELKEKQEAEEYKFNMQRRLEKAKEKLEKLTNQDQDQDQEQEEKPTQTNTIDTRDLITLSKLDISEDSEKAKILAKYKAGGLINNYAEGLNHAGIKAEFAELDSKNKAKTVIDENDSDEVKLQTTKEVVRQYKLTGDVPSDPKLQKEVAKANLEEMGL